jgi:hypothetical protein
MRIQETDRILKEARYARHDRDLHQRSRGGLWQRAWRSVTALFKAPRHWHFRLLSASKK